MWGGEDHTKHVLVLPGDVASDDGGGDEAVEEEGGGEDDGEEGEPVQQLQLTVTVRPSQLLYQGLANSLNVLDKWRMGGGKQCVGSEKIISGSGSNLSGNSGSGSKLNILKNTK